MVKMLCLRLSNFVPLGGPLYMDMEADIRGAALPHTGIYHNFTDRNSELPNDNETTM